MGIEVVCRGKLDNGMYRYVFTDFEQIDDTVKKASRIGFAVPLAGDQFRVIRFDLMGSNEAIAAIRSSGEGGIRGCSRWGGGLGIRRFRESARCAVLARSRVYRDLLGVVSENGSRLSRRRPDVNGVRSKQRR